MNTNNILRIVPGLMATSLVVENIPKKFPMKSQKGMGIKKITKLGMKNIVGVGLIKATASAI